MKFSIATILASLLLTSVPAFAQKVVIASPAAGATVTAGSNITVEIDRPSFQSSSTEVAIVIAIGFCDNGVCPTDNEALGIPLFVGPFTPAFDPNEPQKPPFQNFTVTIPDSIGTGIYQLNVLHVGLVGAIASAVIDFESITLNLQD